MAGRSKWANIQYRKGKQDAARGKVCTGISRAKRCVRGGVTDEG